MRLDAAITDATDRLRDVSESPRLDAEILLCRTINMPRAYLFAHPEDTLDELSIDRFEDVLGRREAGDLARLLTGLPRSEAGPTAPARGLALHEVFYPPEWRLAGEPEAPGA